jgi:acetolactate synthase I/II/III large subunit
MNGAAILVKAIEDEGVDTIFGYPGGAIMPVYDALVDSQLKHILVRHEQAAAFAADAYARVTGKVGVCVATSGPGATNLITGIANAYADSIPIVAITGQVATSLIGTDAFQEVDTYGISMPVVKHSFLIRDAEEIQQTIKDAFDIARSGRPGPVLIDFPKDIANTEVKEKTLRPTKPIALPCFDASSIETAKEMIKQSQKPLIYAGGGVRIAQASAELIAFAETTGIPAVTTLQGLGSIPGPHSLNLGMLGMHGTKAANLAVQECDLLIGIGVRFDDRATGMLAKFAPHAKVIHMDADPAEVGKLRAVQCAILGDLKLALRSLHLKPDCTDWRQLCLARKAEFAWRYDAPVQGIYAPKFIKTLSDQAGENTIITCDVGQHQMWVAQHYQFKNAQHHLTSGGLGAMGYGMPAAIGAQLASPDSTVITISGDGSIMMNIQELATIKRYNIPVKVVVFDNQALGMVRQWQELFFQERYSEVDLSDNPDFVKVAEAFGIPAFRLEHDDGIQEAISKLINTDGPLFVHVVIDPRENVWPLVPPGKANCQMMEASA